LARSYPARETVHENRFSASNRWGVSRWMYLRAKTTSASASARTDSVAGSLAKKSAALPQKGST
jgi:hypothetical protein